MKKVFLFAVLFLGATISYGQPEETQSSDASVVELPRFAVISDIHFGTSDAPAKVPRALKNLISKGNIDAIFITGDITEGGKLKQYDQLLTVFNNKTTVPNDVAVYYMMGNHDWRSFNAESWFTNKLGQPLNQYVEIKGYPFITLSLSGKSASSYSQATKDFLSIKLAEAAAKFPGKPIFVFTHTPPRNTCYGSSDSEGWGSDALVGILNQYPQVVIFTGHSHFSLGDPRSIHQDKFTAVNVGSTTYCEIEPDVVNAGVNPENFGNVTEGVIVNISEEGIMIERWDTFRNEEILPRRTIEAPFDGTNFAYKDSNGLPAPSFATGAKPEVRVNSTFYTVTFPQATDNEVVFRYKIQIMEGGRVITTFHKFSEFYLNSQMPKELSVDFTYSYPTEKTFFAQVTALDSYNNASTPIDSNPFVLYPDPIGTNAALPVADSYTISTENRTIYVKGLSSSAIVLVYNLLGEKHATGYSQNGYVTLNMPSAGVYIVTILNEGKSSVQKIFVR